MALFDDRTLIQTVENNMPIADSSETAFKELTCQLLRPEGDIATCHSFVEQMDQDTLLVLECLC